MWRRLAAVTLLLAGCSVISVDLTPRVRALEETLLREFDPELRADQPMFALMRLQHAACHLAAAAPRATGVMREQAFRRKVRWTLRLIR